MKIKYFLTALFLSAVLISCSHSQDYDQDHNHDESLQLAAYNDTFELFAETSPFAVGEECNITAFITQLSDFKPLEEGAVTAILSIGGEQLKETAENPIKAGVYQFSFTPMKTGAAKLSFEISAPQGISQLVIDGIEVFEDEHDAEDAAHDAYPEVDNGITFTKSQSWKIDFATEEITHSDFGQVIKATAQIQPSAGDERVVAAKTAGLVVFQSNDIVSGKNVGSGRRLFSIDAAGMADNNLAVRFAEAENSYNRAKTEYERKAELAKDSIVSQSDLIQAKTEYDNARSNYELFRQNFTAGKQAVTSPISGFITDVLVQNGQFVEAGQPILRISQNRNLYIKAELQPKHYNSLASITSANIRIPAQNRAYTLEELNGKVVSYGKSSDINNPLIPVVFQVNNSIGLLPGSFVDMYIKLSSGGQKLAVPNGAIVEEMGAYFVMVQVTPALFEKRAVVTGATDGFRTEIIDGITEFERVVSKGTIFVKLAESAGALDPHAGHMH